MKLNNAIRVKSVVVLTLVIMLLVPLLVYKFMVLVYPFTVEQQNVVDFVSGKNIVLTEGFTLEEINHLVDVVAVMQGIDYFIVLLVLIGVLVSFILYRTKGEQKLLASGLFYGGVAVCVLSLLFLVIAVLGFAGLFTQFHRLFFVEGTWIFPVESMIIQLFPFHFFSSITKSILIWTVFIGIILGVFGYKIKQ